MTSVAADAHYKENIGKEKEYVRVGYAYPVKAGETVSGLKKVTMLGTCGVGTTIVAPEDGYVITTYPNKEYLTQAEFEERKVVVDHLKLPIARKSLSAEGISDVTPLQKGEIIKYPASNGSTGEWVAPDHFYRYKRKGWEVYGHIADHELAATFNCASLKLPKPEYLVVADKDAPLVKGIILDREVSFTEADGEPPFKAPKGFFLCLTDESPDGFILAPSEYLNLNLRIPQKPAKVAKGPAAKAAK